MGGLIRFYPLTAEFAKKIPDSLNPQLNSVLPTCRPALSGNAAGTHSENRGSGSVPELTLRYIPSQVRLPASQFSEFPWLNLTFSPLESEFPVSGRVGRLRESGRGHSKSPLTEVEWNAVGSSGGRGTPFGTTPWQARTAKNLGLEWTMRPAGQRIPTSEKKIRFRL